MKFKDKYHDDFNAILLSKGERKKPQKEWIDYGKVPGSSVSLRTLGTYFPCRLRSCPKTKVRLTTCLYEWLDGAGELERLMTVTYRTCEC